MDRILNPFRKKGRDEPAEQKEERHDPWTVKPPPMQQAAAQAHHVERVLSDLSALAPGHDAAFPLIAEGQRQMQQLRETIAGLSSDDRDAWLL
jgi:hypothetical protein